MKETRRFLTTVVLALVLSLFCAAFAAATSGDGMEQVEIKQATAVSISSSVTNILDADGKYAGSWFADIRAEGSEYVLYKLYDESSVLQTGICKLTETDGAAFFGTMKFDITNTAEKSYKIVVSSIDETVFAEARTFQILSKVSSERTVPYMNGVVALDGYTYNPEKTFYDTAEGKDYDLSAAATSVDISLSDTAAQYVIDYVPYTGGASVATITVNYSDLDGNILNTRVQAINETGNTEIAVPDVFTKDGNDYTKVSGQAALIIVNKNSPKVNYTIYYQPVDSNGYYTATFKFVLAGTDTELMPSANVRVKGFKVSYLAPNIITIKDSVTGNVACYRTSFDKASLTLEPDSAVRTYKIEYSTIAEASYTWFVRRIDASTGAIIGKDIALTVNPGETKEQDIDATLDYNGTHYTLDSAMSAKLSHTFGDLPRVSYVYYNPDGYDREKSYEITIRCYSITDSAFLNEYKVAVSPEQLTTVDTLASFTANGNTYVLLNGQQRQFTHNYYSPTRNYTIFYRDINDIQNEVTRVTTVDIISDEFVDGGYIFTDNRLNILENEETGETVVIEDAPTPLSGGDASQGDGSDGALKDIEDREVPLAASQKPPIGKVIVIVAGALVVLFIGAAIIASGLRNKKHHTRRAK